MTQTIIELPKNLSAFGFLNKPRVGDGNLDESELLRARKWVAENLVMTKKFNRRRTSYGLKHNCERDLGERENNSASYVANGTLIAAMILEGYKYDRDGSSPNCYFNFKFKPGAQINSIGERK